MKQRDGNPKQKKRKEKKRKKGKREILETKKHCNRHENAFDRFISRLDMAEERISELGDIAIEYLKTEKQRKLRWKKNPTVYPRTVRQS